MKKLCDKVVTRLKQACDKVIASCEETVTIMSPIMHSMLRIPSHLGNSILPEMKSIEVRSSVYSRIFHKANEIPQLKAWQLLLKILEHKKSSATSNFPEKLNHLTTSLHCQIYCIISHSGGLLIIFC